MLGSVDGRIKQDIWNLGDPHKYFEETAEKIPADAWLVGRVTMQEFSSKEEHDLSRFTDDIAKEDFVASQTAKQFAVVIDASGKCQWDNNMVSTEHVIEVLSEKVSAAYLGHLRSKNVSYIFGGKEKLNLTLVLQKLHQLFGIKTVRIDGGGHVNGSFLEAGLINEFSLVLAPVADGTTGSPSVFEISKEYAGRKAARLNLISVERIYENFLWIRYEVKK